MDFKVVAFVSLLFVAVSWARPQEKVAPTGSSTPVKYLQPKTKAPIKTLVAKPLEPKKIPVATVEYVTNPPLEPIVLEEQKPEPIPELEMPVYEDMVPIEIAPMEEEFPELMEACLNDDKECIARNS